mgnify:FL=1
MTPGRILVVGGASFVGSHLIDYVLREQPSVQIFATRRGHRSDLSNLVHLAPGAAALLDLDLLDAGSITRALEAARPDVVFHLAAQSFVPASFAAPVATLVTNAVGTLNLLEACRSVARVHLCSSSEVYGNVPGALVPIREDAPTNPESPYGVSKLAADRLGAVYWRAYGLGVVTTRAFTHSGPRRGAPFVDSAFCRQVALVEKNRQRPVLHVGNLESRRTFCDVRDLVRAYWLLATRGEPGEVYNVGGHETYAVRDVIEMLRAMTPARFEVEVDATLVRPTDVTNQIPCLDKIEHAISWRATTPYQKTLRDCLDWWRERV